MISISRTRAENRFAAIEKSQKKALGVQEEATNKVRENTARLKKLRLAKEAAIIADEEAKKREIAKQISARVRASKRSDPSG